MCCEGSHQCSRHVGGANSFLERCTVCDRCAVEGQFGQRVHQLAAGHAQVACHVPVAADGQVANCGVEVAPGGCGLSQPRGQPGAVRQRVDHACIRRALQQEVAQRDRGRTGPGSARRCCRALGLRPGLDASRLPTWLPRREGGRVPWLPAAGRPTLPERTGRPRLRPLRSKVSRRAATSLRAAELVDGRSALHRPAVRLERTGLGTGGERDSRGRSRRGCAGPGCEQRPHPACTAELGGPGGAQSPYDEVVCAHQVASDGEQTFINWAVAGPRSAAKVVVECRGHEVEMLTDRVGRGLDADPRALV